MTVLHIRDFPADLHKKLKGLALDNDEPLRALMIRAAEREAERLETERQERESK